MKEHAKEMFADYDIILRKLRKNDYIKNMEVFKGKWSDVVEATITSGDCEKAAQVFVEEVFDNNSRFGKVSRMKTIDLNLFMVYFVFPLILSIDEKHASGMCDVLLEAWNNRFNTDIDYMSYDEILDSFKNKMFGMF